jgi:GNAT superfamily N-acetyltransferase
MFARKYYDLEKDKGFLCNCIKLDYKVYNHEYLTTAYKYLQFFEINNEAFIFLKDYKKNKLAAYLLVLPLDEEAYEDIKSGEVIDVNYIKKEHVLPFVKGRNKLYMSSIVVDPDYQSHGIGGILLDHLFEDLRKKEEQGVITESILVDTVSKGGYALASAYGLEFDKITKHNSQIMERRHKTNIEFIIEKYFNDTAPRERGFHKKGEEYKYISEENKKKRK